MEDNAAPKEENPYPKIAKSIFYTAVISGAITGIFIIGGINWFIPFCVSVIVQIIGWTLWHSFLDFLTAKHVTEMDTQLALDYTKHLCITPCAKCKKTVKMPINLNEPSTFKCEKCGEKNRIYVSIETVLVTDPLIEKSKVSIT